MSGFDALDALRSAGIGIDKATDTQRQVLESLSAEEVAVLTSVKERLTDASPEVRAHDQTPSAEPEWFDGTVIF